MARPSLQRFIDELKSFPTFPSNGHFGAYEFALRILLHYFGSEWIDKHVHAADDSTRYIRWSSNFRENYIIRWRLIEIAENLYNLDCCTGFDEFVIRAKSETNVESVAAELKIASYLYNSWVDFRFNKPIGRKGHDYDLEVRIDNNLWAPADTKAKIEGGAITPSVAKSILNDARSRNLPPDRLGIIFVHLSQDVASGNSLALVAEDHVKHKHHFDETLDCFQQILPTFFRNTKRVVSVVITTSPIYYDKLATQTVITCEFRNLHHPQLSFFPILLINTSEPTTPPRDWVFLFELGKPGWWFNERGLKVVMSGRSGRTYKHPLHLGGDSQSGWLIHRHDWWTQMFDSRLFGVVSAVISNPEFEEAFSDVASVPLLAAWEITLPTLDEMFLVLAPIITPDTIYVIDTGEYDFPILPPPVVWGQTKRQVLTSGN